MNTDLDTYISELLYDYDCVIVPQLGGFVTNYKPAYFHNGIAHPPSKELRFNKNLTKNDGLLSQAISAADNVSIQEADSILHEAVENHLSSLKEDGRVQLKKVGILFMDENNQLRFKPDTTVNYLRQAFGFESFTMPSEIVAAPKVEAEKAVEPERETTVIPLVEPSTYNNGIKWVAAATLLPFIGLSIYLGMTTDFKSPTQITPAEIFPLTESINPKYTVRETADSDAEVMDETGFPENTALFPFDFDANEVDSLGVWVNLNALPEKTATEVAAANAGIYHIIGGCFGEKQNAEKFVKELNERGYQADILDFHKGLYRVKTESFGNYDKALNQLEYTRDNTKLTNAWLLKKIIS